jgi:hypothetical protein
VTMRVTGSDQTIFVGKADAGYDEPVLINEKGPLGRTLTAEREGPQTHADERFADIAAVLRELRSLMGARADPLRHCVTLQRRRLK